MRAVGYVRVSTSLQDVAAQRAEVERECARRGWELVRVFEEQASGTSMKKRPQLDAAIACLESEDCAEVLVAPKLDRLSRSTTDFLQLVERSRKKGWAIVVLDLPGLDFTTPFGELIGTVLAAFAKWDNDLRRQRIREGLAYTRDVKGTRLGRAREIPAIVRRDVKKWHRQGLSCRAIAQKLNERRVPPVRGKAWYHTTVAKVLRQEAA